MKRITAKYRKRLALVAAGLVLTIVSAGRAGDRQHAATANCSRADSGTASVTIDPVGHLAFVAETAPDNVGTYVIDPSTGSLRAFANTRDADKPWQLISSVDPLRKVPAIRNGR
jgi:hypothetical protein